MVPSLRALLSERANPPTESGRDEPLSRRRLLGRILRRSLIAALVVVSDVAGGLYLYGHETLNQLAAHSSGGIAASKDENLHAVASPSAPATALVIGYHMRKGADASGQQSRSDTIMLVRADPTNNTLSVLSFPRDLQVAIYCDGAELPVAHDRINSAWGICKQRQRRVLDTVARLTGLSINYLITVNFHGFKLLVNKMSGVYVNVGHRYINTVDGPGASHESTSIPDTKSLTGSRRSTSCCFATQTPTCTATHASRCSSKHSKTGSQPRSRSFSSLH